MSNWWPSSCCKTTSPIMPLPLRVMLVTVNLEMPHGTFSLETAGGPPHRQPSKCCRTTSPMRHCKADSYKHDSHRQRNDGTCSSVTDGGPSVWHPC
ncbi:unnamed protein product, partial [Staurois parvus]